MKVVAPKAQGTRRVITPKAQSRLTVEDVVRAFGGVVGSKRAYFGAGAQGMTDRSDHTFTLRFQLAADDADHDAIVERLGEAGCTDALVGVGVDGRLALEFVRRATSGEEALRSALEDVQRAVPTSTLLEARL